MGSRRHQGRDGACSVVSETPVGPSPSERSESEAQAQGPKAAEAQTHRQDRPELVVEETFAGAKGSARKVRTFGELGGGWTN